jgi:hypothetical protein
LFLCHCFNPFYIIECSILISLLLSRGLRGPSL